MSDLRSTDPAHPPLGKRGAFEGVARRHGRRRNPARMTPRSSLRTPTNRSRHHTQRWVRKVGRSITNSETPHDAFNAALTNGRSAVEAVRQAKSDGRNAEAERLKAHVAITNNEVQALNDELRRLQALRPDWRTGSHPGARAVTSADDPLDRLQKLADLDDRGVLTDPEFATQKAKVLSEE